MTPAVRYRLRYPIRSGSTVVICVGLRSPTRKDHAMTLRFARCRHLETKVPPSDRDFLISMIARLADLPRDAVLAMHPRDAWALKLRAWRLLEDEGLNPRPYRRTT